MRLIWKDDHGFYLMSYPVEDEGQKGFRAAIIDTRDKIWWLSDDIFKTSDECGPVAKYEWEMFIEEYATDHEHFPDGGLCVDFRPEISVSELIKEQEDNEDKEPKEAKEKSSKSGKSGSN